MILASIAGAACCCMCSLACG